MTKCSYLFLFKHFSSSDFQNIHLLRLLSSCLVNLAYYTYIILHFSFYVLPGFLDYERLLTLGGTVVQGIRYKVFLSFFLEDKTSAPHFFSSCLFLPRTHFETS